MKGRQVQTLALIMKFLQAHGYDLETVKHAADAWWQMTTIAPAAPAASQEPPITDPAAVLAAMSEDPGRRELYLGAGGHWCFVTGTEGAYRIHLNEALRLEQQGHVVRKWPDYAHYWRLAGKDGVGAADGAADEAHNGGEPSAAEGKAAP